MLCRPQTLLLLAHCAYAEKCFHSLAIHGPFTKLKSKAKSSEGEYFWITQVACLGLS